MTVRIIGVTATRRGLSELQREWTRSFLTDVNVTRVHHGDCIGGDEEIHQMCVDLGIPVLIHPPTSNRYRAFCKPGPATPPKPYLARNRDIVDACHLLLALPDGPERVRSGTWSTVRYARKVGRDNLVLWAA